jgi:uncharacterized pyridoxamine 5'-phosphate oxidase family protein
MGGKGVRSASDFTSAVDGMFAKLGECAIMALASSKDGRVTVRNVSGVFYDGRIFFKTDMNFPKTRQLLENPNVAICVGGVQIEGEAKNHGLVTDEDGRVFERLYKKFWDKSYNAYAHEESEILIEIIPSFAEIWDQDECDRGFQTFIYFKTREATSEYYD